MPNSTFINVDLPAPFSPTSAWIVPGRTASDTPRSTRWLSYSFVMPRSSRTGWLMCGAAVGERRSVGDVIQDDEVLIPLLVVLADLDRPAGFLLEVALDG